MKMNTHEKNQSEDNESSALKWQNNAYYTSIKFFQQLFVVWSKTKLFFA